MIMKRILISILLLVVCGRYCRAETGVGFGWPYAGIKHTFSKQISAEAIASAEEGVNLYAARLYWNFRRFDRLNIFTGLEGGRLNFNTSGMKGKGYESALFLGAEYFISKRMSFSMDLAPTFIGLKSTGYKVGGVEWVLNSAMYFYFSTADKRSARRPGAPVAVPISVSRAAEKKKLAVTIFKAENEEQSKADMVSGMIESEFLKTESYEVIRRTGMDYILAEHSLRAEDLTREETLIKLGKAVGARLILCGTLSKGEKEDYSILARMIDVETGKTIVSGTERAESIYDVAEAVRNLVQKFLDEQ